MIQRINLIPKELRDLKTGMKLPAKYIIVILLGLLYILPLNISINSKVKAADSKKRELEKKKLQIVTSNMRFANIRQKTEEMKTKLADIKRISESLKEIIQKRIFWSDILKEVSYHVPKKLWLNEITTKTVTILRKKTKPGDKETVEKIEKRVKIRGSSYNNKTITSFIENLEASVFLKDIKLSYVEKNVINKVFTVYNFEVMANLKKRAQE